MIELKTCIKSKERGAGCPHCAHERTKCKHDAYHCMKYRYDPNANLGTGTNTRACEEKKEPSKTEGNGTATSSTTTTRYPSSKIVITFKSGEVEELNPDNFEKVIASKYTPESTTTMEYLDFDELIGNLILESPQHATIERRIAERDLMIRYQDIAIEKLESKIRELKINAEYQQKIWLNCRDRNKELEEENDKLKKYLKNLENKYHSIFGACETLQEKCEQYKKVVAEQKIIIWSQAATIKEWEEGENKQDRETDDVIKQFMKPAPVKKTCENCRYSQEDCSVWQLWSCCSHNRDEKWQPKGDAD